jgi:hypothetical protein
MATVRAPPNLPRWFDDLFEHIVKFSKERELCTLARVNKFVSKLAHGALYGSITLRVDQRPQASMRQDLNASSGEPSPPSTQLCLETLKSNDSRASLVHNLNIQWQRQTTEEAESMSVDEFGGLLKACLMRLVNLTHLSLEFNVFETYPALNDTFPFQLVCFSTTLPWNEDLVAFLGSQASSLRELRLECDSDSEVDSIPLQNRTFPPIKTLHWGGNAVVLLSTILKKTWQDLQLLHVNFTEAKAAEDVVDLLRQYPTIPSKLEFTFDVQGALDYISGLQTEELWLGGPCVISILDNLTVSLFFAFCWLVVTELLQVLRLSNFERLKSLRFVITERNRDIFTPLVKSTACAVWFDQCPTLRIITFQNGESCDTRKRPV